MQTTHYNDVIYTLRTYTLLNVCVHIARVIQ